LPPDEEGADLFAETVNAAARIAAKAKGGRILASSGLMSARVILRMAHSL
jgi:class 3 adenylate cyclase